MSEATAMPPAQAQPGPAPVTLDNCDQEPIHIPGAVQPHGVLFAFDATGRLCWHSANAAALATGLPELGDTLHAGHFKEAPAVHELVAEAMSAPPGGPADPPFTASGDLTLAGQVWDLVVHRDPQGVIVEFEQREQSDDEIARFALHAHRGLDKFRRQTSVQALMELAVKEVRQLTGFDRVMAYRFRHDDSGDIVAEAHADGLDSLLGRRYPASDIPAQARRLYLLNTLRLIADVQSEQVPLVGLPGQAPLDLSHAVLRSVSPIHIEYLRNMGIGASMSISIVVEGRLWGMLACHHMRRRVVPYSLRMACDVLAQMVAVAVQNLRTSAHARRAGEAAALRSRCTEAVLHADDVLGALAQEAGALRQTMKAHAAILVAGGKLALSGLTDREHAAAVIGSLPEPAEGLLVVRHALADWPEATQAAVQGWCGLLALCFDAANGAWLILLRREQVETVRWGGKPEKNYVPGPSGPRLTPRGSFAEWRETVRDSAVPWSDSDLAIARQWLDELGHASRTRNAEIERARAHLLAVLGHDLRDPLNSISLAAQVLERGEAQGHARLGQRIKASSGRMQRLVEQVLDMTRLRGGLGLQMTPQQVDLVALLDELVEEKLGAYPDLQFQRLYGPPHWVHADPDRLAQVLANLLGNARHHGEPGRPIVLEVSGPDDKVRLEVRNVAPPIPQDISDSLFDPFKVSSMRNPRNRQGLGLGLYIAHEVVRSHGGLLHYVHRAPEVVFTMELPRWQAAAASPPNPAGGAA
ncbi:ATP-binding protein [Ideonella azotifigens]|uniref:histidine kinase n=2 Tax=Ideonella azotifigens TaxID=513160 RepID=A0ABN1JHS2_9BURK|nr:ATP-binding protein [Ideonella azotifigens]